MSREEKLETRNSKLEPESMCDDDSGDYVDGVDGVDGCAETLGKFRIWPVYLGSDWAVCVASLRSDFEFRIFLLLFLLAGCAGPPPYVYHYIPGRTAVLRDGYAIAPPAAPPEVQIAVAAANRISGLPYVYGAGHTGAEFDTAYDCSGAASFVLKAAGLVDSPMPSLAYRHYGEPGPGHWITIYARRDHVFMVIAGLRFDTGWTGGARGPQWTTRSRPADRCVLRHPEGL